uniref:Ionotropic glutamate receptor L-glutamate and glycine-binding domain-containing protein n=1 Tax=Timema tahoe TaxID=61484 RepID=A0A7R9IC73_9NEOP|nr:unnamed protein product [Timema tahoe]
MTLDGGCCTFNVLTIEGLARWVDLTEGFRESSQLKKQLSGTAFITSVYGYSDIVSALNNESSLSSLPVIVMPSCPLTNSFLRKTIALGGDINIVTLDLMKPSVTRGVVWDVYTVGPKTSPQVWLLACWFEGGTNKWQLVLSTARRLPSYKEKMMARPHNLLGVTLRIGVIMNKKDYNYDCHVYMDDKGKVRAVSGYSIDLLDILRNILQFRVEYVPADSWGTLDDEETWTGLMGLLESDKADLVLCHPTVTSERSQIAQFLQPTLHSSARSMLAKPNASQKNLEAPGIELGTSEHWTIEMVSHPQDIRVISTKAYNPNGYRVLVYRASGLPLTQDVFVLTFAGSLWLCLLVMLAVLASCIHTVSQWRLKLPGNKEENWSWVEVTLWGVAAACQQGYSKQPTGVSCRLLFITGYLTSYLLYTGFAAGVTSLLAVQGQDTHLQLQDAVRMRLNFAAYWDGLQSSYLQNLQENDPAAHQLFYKDLRRRGNQLQDLNGLYAHVQREHSMAMATKHPVQQYMLTRVTTDEACQITLSTLPGSLHYKAFAAQKYSPYTTIFNYWLLKVREHGLMSQALHRNMPVVPSCGSGPAYSSAGLGHIMSAILILGSGVTMSAFLMLAEFAWNYHKKGRRRIKLEKTSCCTYRLNIRNKQR